MVFREVLEASKKTGFRGLLVYTGIEDLGEALNLLKPHYNRILVVTPNPTALEGDRNVRIVSAKSVRKLLGYEYDSVIIDVSHGLRPNILGITGEMIRAGGVLLLASTQCYDELKLGLPYGRSTYTRYVKESFKYSRLVEVYDKCTNRTIVKNIMEKQVARAGKKHFTSEKIPKKILKLIATRSQLEYIERFLEFLETPNKVLIGIGDRGRGKSAGLGIALALGLKKNYYSEVPIVALEPYSIQSLMKLLVGSLKVLGYRYRIIRQKRLIVGIKGRDFQFVYYKPWMFERGYRLIAVDEAAAIGVSRLRKLLSMSRKIAATTTIHGYEGSGRSSLKAIRSLVRRYLEVEFKEPVRYLENDPLEDWLYKTFMLNAEPPDIGEIIETRCKEISADELIANRKLLRNIYGILVLAHYRNEPDDLALLLDHPKHFLRVLVNQENKPIAVAQVSVEDPLSPGQLDIITRGGSLPGILLVDKLVRYGLTSASQLQVWRIVRIAVLPEHQGKGYGSKLLASIEDEARKEGIDAVGAIFSGHESLGFWLKNQYLVYYISPRYNKITGEKNIAVIKPLSTRARQVVEQATRIFKKRLLLSAHNIYRDLAVEKIARILESLNIQVDMGIRLLDDDLARLERYYRKEILYETIHDVLFKLTLMALASRRKPPIRNRYLLAVVARTLQGKPLEEVAKILRIRKIEAEHVVDEAHRMIVKLYFEDLNQY